MKKIDNVFLILICVVVIGFITGVLVAKRQSASLDGTINLLFQLQGNQYDKWTMLKIGIKNSVWMFLVAIVCGNLIYGVSFFAVLLLWKGYQIGFSCGAILKEFTVENIWSSTIGLLLPNLILVSLICISYLACKEKITNERTVKQKSLLPMKSCVYYLAGVILQLAIQYNVFIKV